MMPTKIVDAKVAAMIPKDPLIISAYSFSFTASNCMDDCRFVGRSMAVGGREAVGTRARLQTCRCHVGADDVVNGAVMNAALVIMVL